MKKYVIKQVLVYVFAVCLLVSGVPVYAIETNGDYDIDYYEESGYIDNVKDESAIEIESELSEEPDEIVDTVNALSPDSDSISNDIEENDEFVSLDSKDVSYEICTAVDEAITIDPSGDGSIKMNLPGELDLAEGEVTEDGSVVYCEDDVNVCSQILEEQAGNDVCYFVKTAVVIENMTAPHEYTYSFDLPDGYSVMNAIDYEEQQKKYYLAQKSYCLENGMTEEDFDNFINQFNTKSNDIYIIVAEVIVREVVYAPWATDAEGNSVATYYIIEGNCIVQVVDFDENSYFPIVADPTVGTTKSYSFKISNEALGLPGVACALPQAAKDALTAIVKKKIGAAAASKLIPGIAWVSWVLTAVAAINAVSGKNGFQVYGTLIWQKKTYESQGDVVTVCAWNIETLKIKRY